MKKVLVVFSEEKFSESTFDFALELNQISPIQLTAVFVPHTAVNGTWLLAGTAPEVVPMTVFEEVDPAVSEAVRKRFEHRCVANDIPFRIHEEVVTYDLVQLQKESRYADLLLISCEDFPDTLFADATWDNLSRMLHHLECPAIILPEQVRFPDKNIIAFDGSKEAAMAVRQFYSVMPELTALPTYLIYASTSDAEIVPDLAFVEEWVPQHFSDLTIMHLSGKPRQVFSDWLHQFDHPILIFGAMGRGALSRLFVESFAQSSLREHRFPVFIAHT